MMYTEKMDWLATDKSITVVPTKMVVNGSLATILEEDKATVAGKALAKGVDQTVIIYILIYR